MADGDRGFGLLETLVATSLFVVVLTGLAHLTVVAARTVDASGREATALLLALQKMEQLRSLPWGYTANGGQRVSDTTIDLTSDPPGSGGVGLRKSPRDSLDRSAAGYVDYLDRDGVWVGTGTRPPQGTSFIRRWSIRSHVGGSADLLFLEVAVLPVRLADVASWSRADASPPGVVRLSTLRARS